MSTLEIVGLAIGLCFDTFAISLSSGICLPQIKRGEFLKIVFTFALIQSLFMVAGWLLGLGLENLIKTYDHWIAFAVLLFIGGKMIWDAFFKKGDGECIDIRRFRIMIIAASATSIDALAVGVTLAIIDIIISEFLFAIVAIFITTALASTVGLKFGRRIGLVVGGKSEVIGGVIIIAIGIKILVEHLNFLS
ncbi:MAG TPA: manganese efflux pump [Bacteroidales bacterium]|nr:manganese efflux pump [Bacteroidales bacterium]HRT33171.1 manganese efflux pump [Bacteroidales bacterium]HRT83245.1 manganese efflux pump [Bacteroidales bacterium]